MKTICWLLAALMFWAGSVSAQTLEEDGESGLKLPRFVSLRSNQINARSGPGARYPIEWVYMQKGAPVEIIAEFEIWRQNKRLAGIQNLGAQNNAERSPVGQGHDPGRKQYLCQSRL